MSDWYNKWNAEKIEEARLRAKKDCDNALKNMTHTFSDGRVVQIRPQDEPNFRRQISKGEGRNWIMADNSIAMLTTAEMEEAVVSGMAQGETIYDQYMETLNAL